MSNSDSKFKNLLDFLISLKTNRDPWIFRKESAAWAALVLYLPVLFTFYNFVKAESGNCALIFIAGFIVIICGLFLLLLYKNYDSIYNLEAERKVLNYWIVRMIDEDKIPENFSLEIREGEFAPITISEGTKKERGALRKSSHFVIFLVSWNVLFKFLFLKPFGDGEHNYSNIEIQESTIYNLVIFFTLLLLCYILLKIDWIYALFQSERCCSTFLFLG